ncbi:DUF134 domain-containing protein [Clostridium sp. DL1XJH146]
MPRPKKWRRVQFLPESTYFVPFGKRKCELEEVVLKIEEVEAMRLKDIEGLNQEQCAEKMLVSRQTFQNIIDQGRKKVTEALVQGKAVRISGGNYTVNICVMRCEDCGNIFELNFETTERVCPKCGSESIFCTKKGSFCKKHCSGHCR